MQVVCERFHLCQSWNTKAWCRILLSSSWFWKTTGTTGYRQGGILYSGEDWLWVKTKNSFPVLTLQFAEHWKTTEMPEQCQCYVRSPNALPNSLRSHLVNLQAICKWSCKGREQVLTLLWSYNHLTPNQMGFHKIQPVQQLCIKAGYIQY